MAASATSSVAPAMPQGSRRRCRCTSGRAGSCPRWATPAAGTTRRASGAGSPSSRTTIETTKRHSRGDEVRQRPRVRAAGGRSRWSRSSSARVVWSVTTKPHAGRLLVAVDDDARHAPPLCVDRGRRARRARVSPPCARTRSTRNSTSSSSPRASGATPRVHAPCRRATANSGSSTAWLAKRAGTSTMAR